MHLFQLLTRTISSSYDLECAISALGRDILFAHQSIEDETAIHELFDGRSEPKGERYVREHHFASSNLIARFAVRFCLGVKAALLNATATSCAAESFSLIFSVVFVPSSLSFWSSSTTQSIPASLRARGASLKCHISSFST